MMTADHRSRSIADLLEATRAMLEGTEEARWNTDVLVSAVEARQSIVASLAGCVDPLTPDDRDLLCEVESLHNTLLDRCDQQQRAIARELVRIRSLRTAPTVSDPKLISHAA